MKSDLARLPDEKQAGGAWRGVTGGNIFRHLKEFCRTAV